MSPPWKVSTGAEYVLPVLGGPSGLARQRRELLAAELDPTWPVAAGSADDTLTLMRLGISGQLAKTLGRRWHARRRSSSSGDHRLHDLAKLVIR